MQNYFVKNTDAVVLRYEDLCSSADLFFYNLSHNINFEEHKIINIPSNEMINGIAVSGKSGRKTSEISLRERQLDLLDNSLEKEIQSCQEYIRLCQLNDYNSQVEDSPI